MPTSVPTSIYAAPVIPPMRLPVCDAVVGGRLFSIQVSEVDAACPFKDLGGWAPSGLGLCMGCGHVYSQRGQVTQSEVADL